jgi:hypothetical protein
VTRLRKENRVEHETTQAPEHEAPEYEKPKVIDYGGLRELTETTNLGTVPDGAFTHTDFS